MNELSSNWFSLMKTSQNLKIMRVFFNIKSSITRYFIIDSISKYIQYIVLVNKKRYYYSIMYCSKIQDTPKLSRKRVMLYRKKNVNCCINQVAFQGKKTMKKIYNKMIPIENHPVVIHCWVSLWITRNAGLSYRFSLSG